MQFRCVRVVRKGLTVCDEPAVRIRAPDPTVRRCTHKPTALTAIVIPLVVIVA